MQRGDIVAGKYRLNLLLGSGGMAEVWSATNTFTERQVAIKFMNAQVAKTPEAAARFLKEAKVSARVNHPNIIDVLDVGQTDENRLFLVMELLAGYPLETALRRQTPPMTVYEFSLVMIEVAEALAAAHRAGIVHRDLKPTNIYLHKVKNGTAVPKLLDFGVSKFLDDDTNNALTIAGTVLGSPLYMSPEQARGEVAIDGRTDIFAFGTILFEALSGYRPYEGKNFNALIVAIATTKPIAIDEAAPHLPESLRRVVRTCMETNPKRRAQKFEDVIAMMRDALPELEASLDRLPPTHVVSPAEDPEATNPIPMLHRSDRPAHNAASSTGETASVTRSATIPPNAVSTKAGDGSGTFPPPGGTTVTKRYPAWLIGFGATLAIGVVGIGVLIFVRSPSEGARSTAVFPPERRYPEASALPDPTSVTTTAKTAANTTDSADADTSEPPTVSVDALPGAAKAGPLRKGFGRLSVAASPGWCAISIDGKDRGLTPVMSVDLPAGTHQVLCRPEVGKLRTATVTLREGATARYRFALDD